MSTGSSLILIAFLAAVGFGIYKVSQKKKWKMVAIVVGSIIGLCALIGVGLYAYYVYTERPQETRSLGKVTLGMTSVDVTLALGKPTRDFIDPAEKRKFVYENYGSVDYIIRFAGSSVDVICTQSYYMNIFGLGVYDSEQNVIKKLGQPSSVSINKDGLLKFISYERYKVSYEIKEGNVDAVCVSQSGKVTYLEEYNYLDDYNVPAQFDWTK